LVALEANSRSDFNLLQNFRSAESHIMFYASDVLVRRGKGLMMETLSKRREILASTVKPHDHVGTSQVSNQTAKEMLAFVKSHGLEGIISKRSDSFYEPGRRSGLWDGCTCQCDDCMAGNCQDCTDECAECEGDSCEGCVAARQEEADEVADALKTLSLELKKLTV
jgi:ATP-dependent DNA ligase